MSPHIGRVILGVLVGFGLFASTPLASPSGTPADIAAAGLRKAAPTISLHDGAGKKHQLSDYKGHVVLWFMEFQKKYGSKGLSTVGVAVDDEGWPTVKTYLAEHPITYPVVLGDMDLMEKKFGLPASLPVTLLIDRKGRIASTHAGVVEKEKFEADIRQLLDERGQ
jgi:peroxiredoxin